MSSTALYTLGFFAVLAALIYGAILLRLPETWIVMGALIVNGAGILWASSFSEGGEPKP